MEENLKINILQAAMKKKIYQLTRKYTIELVSKVWEEMKMADGDQAFFSVSGWKNEMTLTEALQCLDDYCDFFESMILNRREIGNGEVHYIPVLFN